MGELVTRTGEWEIRSVSERPPDTNGGVGIDVI